MDPKERMSISTSDSKRPRFLGFNAYLRQRFGCRVQKVTIDAGFTCPNRDGTLGQGGCTFCNNAGFSPNVRTDPAVVREQLARGIAAARRRRRKVEKFIAYFQAYTNTYAPIKTLKALYDEAWRFPEVVGMAIGTRPDCVDDEIIDLVASYSSRGEVWIEYGLQSAHDSTLATVNRGHDYQAFLDALERTRGRGIKVCVHTILGLPGETRDMMLETHRRLADLPIDGIKIHLIHIMRDTVMEQQYTCGEMKLLSRPEFVALVCDVLELLPPHVVIQRMHADAPREVLVAPEWCLDKVGILNEIHEALIRRDTWQGKALGFTQADIQTGSRPVIEGSIFQ